MRNRDVQYRSICLNKLVGSWSELKLGTTTRYGNSLFQNMLHIFRKTIISARFKAQVGKSMLGAMEA